MTDLRMSQRDVERVLELATWCGSQSGDASAVEDLLDGVAALVPCDVAFWNWYRLGQKFQERALTGPRHGRGPVRAPLGPWLEHLAEHPIMSGRFGRVTMVSDVLRGRALEETWLYQVAWAAEGIRSEIGLELTHGVDEMNVVVLSRTRGPGFTERDRLVLRLIRPHVDAAIRRVAAASAGLTPREREVLLLVRDGMTNAQVARRLGMAEATVAKHLEHVYARTGIRSRVGVVTDFDAVLGHTSGDDQAPQPPREAS